MRAVEQLYDGKVSAAALVVNGNNRPQVVFTVGRSEPGVGLYVTSGPAS